MRSLWATLATPILQLRRLRVELLAVALLVGLLAITSFVFAAGPRLADRAWQSGLQYELRTATPAQRGLETVESTQLQLSGDADAALLAQAADFQRSELPASVRSLVNGRSVVVTSLNFTVTSPPVDDQPVTPRPQSIRLRAHTDAASHLQVVAGRLPQPASGTQGSILELALSPQTAGAMRLAVGDRIGLRADSRDGVLYGLDPTTTLQLEAEVVGLVRARDRGDPYWFGNLGIDDPDVNPLTQHVSGIALISSGTLLTLGQGDIPFGYQVRLRYQVDPAAARLEQLGALRDDLRRLQLRFRGSAEQLTLRTGLSALLDEFTARRAPAEAVLSVVAIGVLGVALLAVAVVARLLAARRKEGILLWRTRGASARQVVGAQFLEAAAIALPAAALGNLAAALAWPGIGDDVGRRVSLAVGVAAVATLTVIGATLAFGPLQSTRETAPEVIPSRRRLVAEATVIVLAMTGLYLLRLRGIGVSATDTSGGGGAPAGADPFLAAVPVLLGVALGLVVVRAFPFPVQLLGWMAASRRDLVLALGLRQVGRAPSAHTLTLLVVLLAMAVATFSSVITTTIERGQQAAAWLSVGADFQLEGIAGTTLPDNVSLDGLPGVTGSARALLARQVPISRAEFGSIATLLALQTGDYASVTAGTPADASLPSRLLEVPPSNGVGTSQAPIPAIVTPTKPGGGTFAVGETLSLAIDQENVQLLVAEVRDQFPGLADAGNFVILPLPWLRAALPKATLPVTRAYLRAGDVDETTLRTAIQERWPPAILVARQTAYDALHASPVVQAVAVGFLLGLAVAAAYAAMAVVIALALTVARRSRDLAYLRTMGLSPGQTKAALLVEHAPPLVIAVIAGGLLGLGVAILVAPGLSLQAFTGPGVVVPLQVDPLAIAGLAAGVALTLGIGVLAASAAARRVSPARILRTGEA
jgi:putative ABC transport system permease protein